MLWAILIGIIDILLGAFVVYVAMLGIAAAIILLSGVL